MVDVLRKREGAEEEHMVGYCARIGAQYPGCASQLARASTTGLGFLTTQHDLLATVCGAGCLEILRLWHRIRLASAALLTVFGNCVLRADCLGALALKRSCVAVNRDCRATKRSPVSCCGGSVLGLTTGLTKRVGASARGSASRRARVVRD